ncbi:hypothetical protein C1646_713042 [Rhizophagus diaphanus]|nr:hypothetical protein C1646_713042 [Rhizophagus diaphanus] [Rhizophagus sp. MUCL 43196]
MLNLINLTRTKRCHSSSFFRILLYRIIMHFSSFSNTFIQVIIGTFDGISWIITKESHTVQ